MKSSIIEDEKFETKIFFLIQNFNDIKSVIFLHVNFTLISRYPREPTLRNVTKIGKLEKY
jgi:hypothetical protein